MFHFLYLAMFTPTKTYTDRMYADTDFSPVALTTSNYNLRKNNANNAVIYKNSGGFWANFGVTRYPTGLTGGDHLLATDNGGNAYNKLYYVVCNGGTCAVGELWMSETHYVIKA